MRARHAEDEGGAAGRDPVFAGPRTLKVLIVDDVDEQRSVYETVLRHAGFEVLHARDGQEAVERALETPPDLMVLDLRLPDFNGLEVFGILCENAVASNIPVIAVTADAGRYPASHVLPLGFKAYLSKPVDPMDLRRVALELTKEGSGRTWTHR